MTVKDIVDQEGNLSIPVESLEEGIRIHAQEYYEGSPSITDEAFDDLVDLLRSVSPESELLTQVGWGFDVTKTPGKKSDHKYSIVGSLSKYRTIESLPKEYLSQRIVLSAKLDGLSSVVYYKDGKLDKVLTRGIGTKGTDITDKWIHLRTLAGYNTPVPEIPGFTGAIRGELVVSNHNYELLKKKYPDVKNPRNYAAGLFNREGEVSDDLRYVSWVPYNILAGNSTFRDQIDVLNFLDEEFECCVERTEITYESGKIQYVNTDTPGMMMDIPSVLTQEYLEKQYELFKQYYPCDGVVMTLALLSPDDSWIYDDGAYDVHHTQLAYKFRSDRATTTVDHVEWSLSRLGTLVPVVILDPVDLSGVTIRRATGFNAAYIEEHRIGKGAEVIIERSGEVIPDIQEVTRPAPHHEIPDYCPECGHQLVWSGVHLQCINEECSSMKESKLHCWISWLCNPETYEGVGQKIIQKYLDKNGITSIDELMSPEFEEVELSGVQMKRVSQIIKEVRTRPITIDVALRALNIPGLGGTRCSKIAKSPELCTLILENYEDLMVAHPTNPMTTVISEVAKCIGNSVALNMQTYSSRLRNLKYLVGRIQTLTAEPDDNLSKGTVAITGKLSMKRSEFESLLNSKGYSVGGITKGTKFLITDNPNSGSSKNKKADQLGIPKITEKEFVDLYMH